jgi:hypothetical protein
LGTDGASGGDVQCEGSGSRGWGHGASACEGLRGRTVAVGPLGAWGVRCPAAQGGSGTGVCVCVCVSIGSGGRLEKEKWRLDLGVQVDYNVVHLRTSLV